MSADKMTLAKERADIIEAAAEKVVEALREAKAAYGDNFKRNGAHLVVLARGQEKFREKPGKKRATEVLQ